MKYIKNYKNNLTLPKGMLLAKTEDDFLKVKQFKKNYCDDDRVGVAEFQDDGFDSGSYVFFSTDTKEHVIGTSRLLFDSDKGFPEEKLLPQSILDMRGEGKKIAEFGRFLITKDNKRQFKLHYKTIYEVALSHDVDVVLIVMKQKHIASHEKMMAVDVLSYDMGNSWDEEAAPLCLVGWHIKEPQPKLHKWIGFKVESFSTEEWDEYSPFHLGVLTSVQHELYDCVSKRLYGEVLDAGCGTARIMGYIRDNPDVHSYTGVDCSIDMIKQALWLKEKLGLNTNTLQHLKAEDVDGVYDSIVSIHSFYSWPDQNKVLSQLYESLSEQGCFVLVTPNNNFDTEKLIRMVDREVIGHPYYEQFLEINSTIANTANENNLYGSIDELIGQVREVGFHVQVAHSDFFLGGASYLELTK